MAAEATYEPIATTTLSGNASDITFTSIASSWTDLRVVLVANNNAGDWGFFRINGDTGSNYSFTQLSGNGSSASSTRVTSNTYGAWENVSGIPSGSGVFEMSTLDFFSYAGSTYKTILVSTARDTNGSGNVANYVNLWRSTSAITSIKLYPNAGSFTTGTTATLYGIKAA